MKTRIQKWGNSLALRIPKAFAAEANLSEESVVSVSVVEGRLVVTAVAKPKVTLEELLAGITDENLHGEVSTGSPVGSEEW